MRHPVRRLALVVAALSAGALLAAPLALASPPVVPPSAGPGAHSSYVLGGKRWPGRPARISYYNTTSYRSEVDKAVAAWNASGAKMKFVKTTKSRAKVHVIYEPGPGGGESFCFGRGHLGFYRQLRRHTVWLARNCNPEHATAVATHEFGHILGLHHEDRRCATMNSSVQARCALTGPQPWMWRCRVLETDDIRGAVKRYSGSARPAAPEFCSHPILPPPSAPAVGLDAGLPVVSWTNVKNRRLNRVKVMRRAGLTCPTSADDALAEEVWVGSDPAPGQRQSVRDEYISTPGPHCYALWSVDNFGRPSASPVTVTLAAFVPPAGPDPWTDPCAIDPDDPDCF